MTQPRKPAPPRYQKVRELGKTEKGDRITYLAKDNRTGRPVVLKQYNFGENNVDWAGADAYRESCQGFARLECPNLPRYRNFLPLKTGFATVRDYLPGRSLAEFGEVDLEQWRKIAIALLETLVCLQSQTPPVFHRNIKPENVLIDNEGNPNLVDFGFGFIDSRGNEKLATVGTRGFMPREQLRNKKLTEASDLFGLGATLTCLLTKTPSDQIEKMLGPESDLDIRTRLPKAASFKLLDWLEKMTQLSATRRYKSAAAALEALQALEMTRFPEATLERDRLEFAPSEYGETVTTALTVRNTVPDTLLQGRWELAEHPSDGKRRLQWIAVKPKQFESNKTNFEIAIDGSKLLAGETFDRELLLHSNDPNSPHRVSVQVVTPPFPKDKLPFLWLLGVFILGAIGGLLGGALLGGERGDFYNVSYAALLIGYVLGAIGGLTGAFELWAIAGVTFAACFGGARFLIPRGFRLLIIIGQLTAFAAFWSAGYVARNGFRKPLPPGSDGLLSFNVLLTAAIATCGLTIGFLLEGGWLGLVLCIIASLSSGALLWIAYSRAAQRENEYRKARTSLLKP